MRSTVSAILFLGLAALSPAQQNGSASRFDGNSWWAHVKFLADDWFLPARALQPI